MNRFDILAKKLFLLAALPSVVAIMVVALAAAPYALVAVPVLVIVSSVCLIAMFKMTNAAKLGANKQLGQWLGDLGVSEPANNDPWSALDSSISNLKLQLREHKRKQDSLIQRAMDLICVLDPQSRFTFVSPSCVDVLGYTEKEMLEMSLNDLLAERKSPGLNNLLGADMSTACKFETALTKKNGNVIHVVITGHWSASDNGLFCIIHDITARMERERLKREFMAMLTHDLKIPLTSMIGLMALLEKGAIGELNPKGKSISQKVQKDMSRLLRLINDLLDIEKIELGKFSLDCRDIRVADAIDQARQLMTPLADLKNVALESTVCEFSCWADEERVVQVLVNLLSNAISFAPEESTINITCQDLGSTTRIAVTDQGHGIAPDNLEKIFSKFEQVKSSDSTKRKGTGLGLAICKSIVEEHGGEIGVNSQYGNGCEFWFTLNKHENGNGKDTAH